ncbi:hypothetical protein L1049_027094 [Liquidambar formosana]|uniref:CN hydrolase domain-containing protein n=1 Tax=Liquidambar formosana TaxID=63359 RepID=A0AAP0N2X5_LIQFO
MSNLALSWSGPTPLLSDDNREYLASEIHLFDVDIPGDILFKESDTLAAGNTPTIVDTDVGRIGIGICHDIRFPELAMLYGARGARLICYPGAFNMSTGELLWELVQRARQEASIVSPATVFLDDFKSIDNFCLLQT